MVTAVYIYNIGHHDLIVCNKKEERIYLYRAPLAPKTTLKTLLTQKELDDYTNTNGFRLWGKFEPDSKTGNVLLKKLKKLAFIYKLEKL